MYEKLVYRLRALRDCNSRTRCYGCPCDDDMGCDELAALGDAADAIEKLQAELEQFKSYFPDLNPYQVHLLVKGLEANNSRLKQDGPCGLCQFNPPSSLGGKPCSMCTAVPIVQEESNELD